MFKIRTSKYRHVFCDQPKPELCFTGFRLSTTTGESQYIKASSKYWSVSMAGGGGPVVVGRHDRPGRFENGTSQIIQGHTGSVLDMDWNPFDDTMLATASEDTTIKLWSIPEDWEPTDDKGIAKAGSDLSESILDLEGHTKKVTLLRWHFSAGNTLLSTSADHSVKVWDVESNTAVTTLRDLPDLTYDLMWDFRGDNYAVSCKDKSVRLVDGRTSKESSVIDTAHEGAKSMKLYYMGESGKLLSTGASKQSGRELKIWDVKNLSKPLHTEAVDTASGALIPLYDYDTQVLFLCGKGDGIVRIYEFEDKDPFIHKLNDGFRSTIPGKGYCTIPKRGCDVMACETARIMKVTNNEGVHPLQFIVPRKSDAFQEDIFPDCFAPEEAMSHSEWKSGTSKPPVTMSINPKNKAGAPPKKTMKTVGSLSKEVGDLKKRIGYLEKLLTDNGIAFDK